MSMRDRYAKKWEEWHKKRDVRYLLIRLAERFEQNTSKDFAAFIGIHASTVSRWFNESADHAPKRPLTRKHVLALSQAIAKGYRGNKRLKLSDINDLLEAIGEESVTDDELAAIEAAGDAGGVSSTNTLDRRSVEALLALIQDTPRDVEQPYELISLSRIKEAGITTSPGWMIDRLLEESSPARDFIGRHEWDSPREGIVVKRELTGADAARIVKFFFGDEYDETAQAEPSAAFELFRTQVSALDRLLGGGFKMLRNSTNHNLPGLTVVVHGPPGAGKSTLALSLCVAWARQGNQSLYCALEQSANGLKQTVKNFNPLMEEEGWEWQQGRKADPSWPTGGAVKVIELQAVKETFEARQQALEPYLKAMHRDRPGLVVIDSLNVMTERKVYRKSVLALKRMLDSRGVIAIFLVESENSIGEQESMEQFLADVVIELNTTFDQDYLLRTLEIKKARYQAHALGKHFMKIRSQSETENNLPGGIHLFPSLHFHLYEARKAGKVQRNNERQPVVESRRATYLSTGIPTLDKLLGAGLKAQTTTALVGPVGPLKKAIALSFLSEGIRRNERVILFSTAANPEDALSLRIYAGDDEIDLQEEKDKLLAVKSFRPGFITPEEFVDQIRGALREKEGKPIKRAVFDNIAHLPLAFPLVAASKVFLPTLMDIFTLSGITSIFLGVTDEDGQDGLNRGLLIRAENAFVLSRTPDFKTQMQILKLAGQFVDPHPISVEQDATYKITVI